MAEEKDEGKDTEPAGTEEAPARPKLKLDAQSTLALANSLFIVAALGLLVYTKLLYKKPVIDEASELKQKQEELAKPAPITDRVIIPFDQLRINIAMTSGKAHYGHGCFSTECRDAEAAELVKRKRDLLIDKLIAALGHRQMTELNTVQGKLILKSELLRKFNEITAPAAVTDLFFSTFILQ